MATHTRKQKLELYAERRRARGMYDIGIYDNDARFVIARSLSNAHQTMETLQLYAKSVVRMLEACNAKVDALQSLSGAASPGKSRGARKPMDLQFVRADIDRLVGEAQALLATVNYKLVGAGIT